jgi:hypothetical protein
MSAIAITRAGAGRWRAERVFRSARAGSGPNEPRISSVHALGVSDLVVKERFAHLIADGVQRRKRNHRLLKIMEMWRPRIANRRAIGVESRDVDRRACLNRAREQDLADVMRAVLGRMPGSPAR